MRTTYRDRIRDAAAVRRLEELADAYGRRCGGCSFCAMCGAWAGRN